MRDSNESDTYSELSESTQACTNNVATSVETAPDPAALLARWDSLDEETRAQIARLLNP